MGFLHKYIIYTDIYLTKYCILEVRCEGSFPGRRHGMWYTRNNDPSITTSFAAFWLTSVTCYMSCIIAARHSHWENIFSNKVGLMGGETTRPKAEWFLTHKTHRVGKKLFSQCLWVLAFIPWHLFSINYDLSMCICWLTSQVLELFPTLVFYTEKAWSWDNLSEPFPITKVCHLCFCCLQCWHCRWADE